MASFEDCLKSAADQSHITSDEASQIRRLFRATMATIGDATGAKQRVATVLKRAAEQRKRQALGQIRTQRSRDRA